MVRWINQPNWRYEKQYIQICLMTEKELMWLEKFAKENGYNDELKDIYLREVIDRNKEYEWDLITTKHSTSYKHYFSYWDFSYCFKDYSNSRGISGKKFMY